MSAKNYRRYFDPAGNYVTSYPSTPSSQTRLRNTLAALRRAGFVWPPPVTQETSPAAHEPTHQQRAETKMPTWTVHLSHAYDGRPGSEQAESLEEALADLDGVVSAGDNVLHVDLTLIAPDPVSAARQALEQVEQHPDPQRLKLVGVEALPEQEAQRRLLEPALPELAGGREVAEMLGVSKQRLHQLLGRDDFPDPVVRLAAGPVWLVSSVCAFERQWARKPGRPAAALPVHGVVSAHV